MSKSNDDDEGVSIFNKQVISEYARRSNIGFQEAERQYVGIIDVIIDCLLQVGYVHMRRLGHFHTVKRKNAKFRNHHTGMTELVPIVSVLKFKPAKSFKRLLNDKTKHNLHLRFKK